jgi:hypothetical protein
VSKAKLYIVYKGLSLRIVLRFGKGTDEATHHITAVFELAANNVERLEIMTTFPDTKPIQRLTNQIAGTDDYKIWDQ